MIFFTDSEGMISTNFTDNEGKISIIFTDNEGKISKIFTDNEGKISFRIQVIITVNFDISELFT